MDSNTLDPRVLKGRNMPVAQQDTVVSPRSTLTGVTLGETLWSVQSKSTVKQCSHGEGSGALEEKALSVKVAKSQGSELPGGTCKVLAVCVGSKDCEGRQSGKQVPDHTGKVRVG